MKILFDQGTRIQKRIAAVQEAIERTRVGTYAEIQI